MKKNLKRTISATLAIALCIAAIPVGLNFATAEQGESGTKKEIVTSGNTIVSDGTWKSAREVTWHDGLKHVGAAGEGTVYTSLKGLNVQVRQSAAHEETWDDTFLNYPFFSDKNDDVTYFVNSMWEHYSNLTYSNQPYVGLGVGWAPGWYNWLSMIRAWSPNEFIKDWTRDDIRDVPMSSTGYVWSYDTPHWVDLGHKNCDNYHYDNNFNYVIAVLRYCAWENSLDFLNEKDTDTVNPGFDTSNPKDYNYCDNHDAEEDVSKDKTVGEKLDMAIKYIMDYLYRQDAKLICIGYKDPGHEEQTHAASEANDGTGDAWASNYWDNLPFGYYDAYENILFYIMLNSLTDYETRLGNSAKAAEYTQIAADVKVAFNNKFWNASTKRFAATVDKNGVMRDYGVTFVNTEAITAGLVDNDRANLIYQWLEGDRTVDGDNLKGDDIYFYKIAPTTNTVNFATGGSTGASGEWWHDNAGGQALSGNGAYGGHLENGGAILYTTYYDIMGRLSSSEYADGVYAKMQYLATEYAIDEFARDADYMNTITGSGVKTKDNKSGYDVVGFDGEYSESGLLPMVYMYGFLGLDVGANGMTLNPNMPAAYNYFGVKDVVYGNNKYDITLYKTGGLKVESANDAGQTRLDLNINLAAWTNKTSMTLKCYDRYDNLVSVQTVTAADGSFAVNLTGKTGVAYAVLA